jgi:hypothetical protein
MKWSNRLKAVLTKTAESGFSEESLETSLPITDKTPLRLVLSAFVSDELRHSSENITNPPEAEKQLNLVSSAFVSAYSRHSSENKEEQAELKSDYFHDVLNRFIENGVAFDVSSDDFLFIDTAQTLKLSDMEFLKLNHSIVLCTLQQSLLVKHLFNHSPEQFEDFAFEIQERESIFSEECLNSPLTKTDKTPFEIYFAVVKEVTRRWFADLLKKKEGKGKAQPIKDALIEQGNSNELKT